MCHDVRRTSKVGLLRHRGLTLVEVLDRGSLRH